MDNQPERIVMPQPDVCLVERTSTWPKHDEPPCPEAFIVLVGNEKKWGVRVNDILDFVRKHGRCVIDFQENSGLPIIEIYDNHRE